MRLAIIGTGFMGRAHSHALVNIGHFPEVGAAPERLVCCSRTRAHAEDLARQFGWKEAETNWEKVVGRRDVDGVIVCTSTASHAEIVMAALRAGKHVLCEKPLARDSVEAKPLLEAAVRAGVCHAVGFNYRRVPAIALAKKWIDEGRLGQIRHVDAFYLQDWSNDPAAPFNWRHDLREAGPGEQSGHIVDLARYLVGEIESVCGMQDTVIRSRPVAGGGQRTVDTEDIAGFLARFTGGPMGTFFSSRVAFGEKNALRLGIYGTKGSIRFDLERLNELKFSADNDPADAQGFRTVLVTQSDHPYLNGWWPPGHALGWDHSFVHQSRDFVMAAGSGEPMFPDFRDGLECIAVLEAVAESARTRGWTLVKGVASQSDARPKERRST
jgi:predicted dehydrogenase